MVINSTNINKMNKHSPTFHLNWTHWTKRKNTTYNVGNPGPGLGQAQKCWRVERLMGSQPFPLDLDLQRQYINKGYIWISLLYRSQKVLQVIQIGPSSPRLAITPHWVRIVRLECWHNLIRIYKTCIGQRCVN